MVYITTYQTPHYHQMTLEELLFGTSGGGMITSNKGNTKTVVYDDLPARLVRLTNTDGLIRGLCKFNADTEALRAVDRSELYYSFRIPKKKGGFRQINAPNAELREALYKLKFLFEHSFNALYHTAAFAYVPKRCTVDAIKRHQANQSRWFAKFDLHDFFGSTTLDFVMNQFSMIYPFSEVCKIERGREELRKALELAFLNGGLPQGTPISPLITNIMMIPVDFYCFKNLRDFEKQRFVYTRYADDFIISSQYDFNFHHVEDFLIAVLRSFNAPFSLNKDKTRYGSSAGGNWNLGVMLNKDNEITVGSKNKRQFQCALVNYINDRRNGTPWALDDLQHLMGLYSYYRMVERETIDGIVAHINRKFNADVINDLKAAIRG